MECAETVMAADPRDPAAYKALVDARMMQIFEACSFQDITGQRIAKVVETLQQIEQRVSRFVEAMRAKDLGGTADAPQSERAERNAKFILNGPAREGEGIAQSEVDALFA
jgi:chemotaxis protein CheZ